MNIKIIRPFWGVALLSAAIFLLTLVVNEIVFPNLAFITGVNWIYLPAGIRLLCTLLFAEAGATGLLIASWAACFFYLFPHDIGRSLAGGVISALAPYVSYLFIERRFGLGTSLRELSGKRLLIAAVLYAVIGSSLHHIWFGLSNDPGASLESWGVMFIGDLSGTLITLYFFRIVIVVAARCGSMMKS
ncbi:hypothetical protein [Herbaspirillum sp. alder98]|uniref:hypothetical protein n=1 Tax=Herbaspirillum sp. alder98 TaxID=2913096 RepID=UPI001CD86C65|nr:hypothetical protein [Herbaspirillum sp. alder98]MCA1324441.1 hypothetical protein [Herbaspirillum sp. alder98]